MADDVTTQSAAPAPAGQPVAPPAVPVQQTIPLDTTVTPAAEPSAAAAPAPAALAPDPELANLRREIEALKLAKPQSPATAAQPAYTPEQLETWKEQWLVEAATKPEKAPEAARQIRLIDAELRKSELAQFAGRQTAATAMEKLTADVKPLLSPFQAELVPGTALYNEAQALHQQAVLAGYPDNPATATQAVILALLKSGKLQAGGTAAAATAATKSLNQAIRSAAAAGSGAANSNAAPGPDFSKFDPKTQAGQDAFAAYRKSLGVGK